MTSLKCWKKNEAGWGHKGGGWIYVYPKKLFRGKENEVVISTSLTGGSNPKDRQNKGFKSERQALRYAKEFMKENKC